MAEEIQFDPEAEDVVVVDRDLPDYLFVDETPREDVVLTYEFGEIMVVERLLDDQILVADAPRDVIIQEPELGPDVVVSLSEGPQGPPGDEGPPGDQGPPGNSVVDMTVVGSNLIATLSDGTQIDAGEIPSGTSPIKTFTFATPSTLWVCNHDFGRRPVQVITYDSSGVETFGDVTYVDDNTLEVRWYHPNSGSVHITK